MEEIFAILWELRIVVGIILALGSIIAFAAIRERNRRSAAARAALERYRSALMNQHSTDTE